MTDFKVRQDEKSKWRLDIAHHEIHAGDHYTAAIVDETMINSEIILLAFKTPDTSKYLHVVFVYYVIVAGNVEILEAGTWTHAQQSTVNIINSNRNAGNTSGALENASQTDFNAGSKLQGSFVALQSLANTTVVWQDWIMAGGASKGGGFKRGEDEVVLKQDTTYVVRLTADGAANGAFLGLSWYEHQIED